MAKVLANWQQLYSTHFAFTVPRTGREVIATHPYTFYLVDGVPVGLVDLIKRGEQSAYRYNVLVPLAALRDIISNEQITVPVLEAN